MDQKHDALVLEEARASLAARTDLSQLSDVMKEFRLLMETYNAGIGTVTNKLQILGDEFRAKYDYNPIHHIESRLKEPQSIFAKMKRLELPLTLENMKSGLSDIAGVRVICNYLTDVELLADLLLRQDDVELIRRTDYIHHPKESGYRSLHLVVTVPVFLAETTERVEVEIQIRTIAMDCWASLEHHLGYKAAGVLPQDLRYRLKICAMTIAEVDEEMQAIKDEIERLRP